MAERGGARPAFAEREARPRARLRRPAPAAAFGLIAAALFAVQIEVLAQSGPGSDVECRQEEGSASAECAVELDVYIGWRVFDRYCASCHASDAEGSSFAPSLVHRITRMDRAAFRRALERGYTGPRAPMRPWGEHRQVRRYYDELWAYLSGRAGGAVPPAVLAPLRD